MNKIVLSSVLASSMLLFTACGNGGSTTSANTGTGYYVDSAVGGVEYVCGNQKGITADDGSFKFEKGKDCTFKLGDIQLRAVKAENLLDNVKILEDRIEVAQMLQTLDMDGNPDNGITIKKEIITAMKEAGITKLPTTDDEVAQIFSVIEHVTGYKGEFKDKQEAKNHLDKSLSSELKTLVSGKTFYHVGIKPDGSTDSLEKNVVNATSTLMTYHCIEGCENNEGGSENINIVGTDIVFEDGDKAKYTKQTSDYILLEDSYGKHYMFYSEAKAKAYYDSLKKTTPPSSTTDLKALLGGKTFYADDEKIVFNTEVTSLTNTDNSGSNTDVVSISGNKLMFPDDPRDAEDGGYAMFVSKTSDYLIFADYKSDGTYDEETRIFYDQAKAKAYYDSLKKPTPPSNGIDAQSVVSGKTYYTPVCDEYPSENDPKVMIKNDHVEKLLFQTDGKLNISWMENNKLEARQFNYTTTGDTINISGVDDNAQIKISEVGLDWLVVTDGKFYVQEALAIDELNNGKCSHQ